jgi:hypothetical protein
MRHTLRSLVAVSISSVAAVAPAAGQATVSEFGGGLDVMLLTASKLDLFTGPAVGYIRDGTDARWTWSGRVINLTGGGNVGTTAN